MNVARARNTPQAPPEPALLKVPRDQFEVELNKRVEIGEELLARAIQGPDDLEAAKSDYYTWNDYNTEFLKRRFTTGEVADDYSSWAGVAFGGPQSLHERIEDYRDDIRQKLRRLDSIKKRIELFDELASARTGPRDTGVTKARKGVESIFVVHGHDDALKLEVDRFIRDVTGLKAVILHNEPSKGRTILEKFEAVGSSAGYAVVLLTADDVGGPQGSASTQARARQNVVWEFGFFAGALGRSHVAVLYEAGVELPSDLHGLVYIPYDEGGGWKLLLARELKAAEINVDTNKLI